MKTYIPICAALLLLTSCTTYDESPTPINTNIKSDIRLNDLHAGQSNQFLRFSNSCNVGNNFQYTGDTLVAEVINLDGGLGIRESFTAGSTNFSENEPGTYPVILKDTYLLLPQRDASWLFFFFGNDTLPVEKPEDTILNQGLCFIEYMNGERFIGEEVGVLSNFETGDIQYFDKRVVSCVPPFMNLDGYLLYDDKQLFVSMTLATGIAAVEIDGFALIPKD